MRLFIMPILGCYPRPKNSPGGSTRKLPTCRWVAIRKVCINLALLLLFQPTPATFFNNKQRQPAAVPQYAGGASNLIPPRDLQLECIINPAKTRFLA